VQEDVDIIGVSLLSGAHMTLFPQIIERLRDLGVSERYILVGGGVIPDDDVVALKEIGVAEILGQEHDGHAPLAQLPLEGISAAEAALQTLLQAGHGCIRCP